MTLVPHFLSTQHLTQEYIFLLIKKAQLYLNPQGKLQPSPTLLKNKIVANLFFENSTRTRCSFEIGAQKLGAYTLNFKAQTASTQKGESLLDTVKNLVAMGIDLLVIRHPESGLPAWLAKQIAIPIINAGDGSNEHPTQAMLDVLTIYCHKPNFTSLTIAIIGDIRHSRVAKSLCFALHTLGVKDIRLIGPPAFLPEKNFPLTRVSFCNDLLTGIQDADIVMTLRIQHERFNKEEISFDLNDYIQRYKLTSVAMKHARPDAIVMHPGPINRGVEIESDVADGAQSLILEQPTFGVAMRMAIMSELLF